MLLNRTLYFAFVALLAFSPVLSLILSDLLGLTMSMWTLMWVGVGLSLPISLMGARAFGERAYGGYWAYLESFPGNSRARVLAAWAGMTALALVLGIAELAI